MTLEQAVLPTLVSAILAVVFLLTLLRGLRLIERALSAININASKILWGVRAIEIETSALPRALPELHATLGRVIEGAGAIATTLGSADQRLGRAASALGGPKNAGPTG